MKHFLALGLLFLGLISGCGSAEDTSGKTKVKVAFWGSPEEIEIIKDVVGVWETQNPDIEVVLEHTPYSGYDSKILTRIAGGAAPDIIATEVDYFVTFASKGVLQSLDAYMESDESFSRDSFFESILKRFEVGGELFALPRDVAPFACVYYNKDLFDEAGIEYPKDNWTWDDLLSKARALTKKDETGRVVQYGFYGWAWQNFVYGNGGALVDDLSNPKEARISDPRTVQGLQFYADLINLYGVMPTMTALSNIGMGVNDMFANGRIAMFLSGIWETPVLRKQNFNWDVAMFPKGPNGERAFGSGGTGYAILKSSKNKEAAWRVIKALTGPQGQQEMARRGLAQPSRKQVAEGESFAKSSAAPLNKGMLNEAVEHIVFSPFHPRWREIQEKFVAPQLDLVFSGKKTAEDAASELAPKINQLLKA